MQRFCLALAGVVALAAPAFADDYRWLDHRHGCLVTAATAQSAELDASTRWNNAPKSFFIELMPCSRYVQDPNANSVGQIECELLRSEARRIAPGTFDTAYKLKTDKLTDYPEAWDLVFGPQLEIGAPAKARGEGGALLRLQSDGSASFVQGGYASNSQSTSAWFLLHASCTPLD